MVMLIADDELIIRKGLTTLDWSRIGIERVLTAEHGIQAKEIIQNEKVDILLTDIRMPGFGGLDLAEYIHTNSIDIAVVLLTGYSEFEYARKAIKHQVYDYILKPLRAGDIMNTVLCVKEKLEQKRFQNKIVMEQGEKISKNDIVYQLQSCFYDTTPQIFEILVDIGKNYNRDISLGEISDKYGFTNTYLSRLIKKETKYSFIELLTSIRMLNALIYMRNERYKLSEICDFSGFHDQKYFCHVFKKIFKCTPSEFRKNPVMMDLRGLLYRMHEKDGEMSKSGVQDET